MTQVTRITRMNFALLWIAIGICSCSLSAQGPSDGPTASADGAKIAVLLDKLDRVADQNEQLAKANQELAKQNSQLQKQNQELMADIDSFRRMLRAESGVTRDTEQRQVAEAVPPDIGPTTVTPANNSAVRNAELGQGQEEPKFWGRYTPNLGFKVANTEYGDMNVSIFTYGRYLNQRALQSTYTNAFGVTTNVQPRQDFQLNKVQIRFLGWAMDPKLRYFIYVWTTNAAAGQPAQIVVGGNVSYNFNKYISIGTGFYSLPGTRTLEGNFPFWLALDSRHIGDEFFRPSYTSGVRAAGTLAKGLNYQAMIGNNISQLGVNAGQLPAHFNTTSAALVWMPTTGEFGAGYGDFENHEKVATRLGVHFTFSDENKQSQPNSDAPENTQLRLSDGSIVFTPGLFGPGVVVTDVDYKMASFDQGIKYKGYSLESEYYLHWLSNFRGTNTAGIPTDFTNGFQIQTAAMLLPKTLQLYAGGSLIIGHYGRPWDFRTGVNYFPFKNRVVRWNTEFLYLNRSPVGYSSVPFAFGGTGPVFHTNFELAF